MRRNKFKPGDMVRVKDYETLRDKYYDRNARGICHNEVYFPAEMKYLCDYEFEIIRVSRYDDRVLYYTDPEIQQGWSIEEYMIERAEKVNTLIDYDAFMNVISAPTA